MSKESKEVTKKSLPGHHSPPPPETDCRAEAGCFLAEAFILSRASGSQVESEPISPASWRRKQEPEVRSPDHCVTSWGPCQEAGRTWGAAHQQARPSLPPSSHKPVQGSSDRISPPLLPRLGPE